MIELQDTAIRETRKWYKHHKFPIVPVMIFTKGDTYNTNNFCFQWLFFHFWTLDAFDFELSIVVSSHWGVGAIGILPYLRWAICVPLPKNLTIVVHRKLWRRPKGFKI